MKCSECYRTWCNERNLLIDKCVFVDGHFSGESANKIKIEIAQQMEKENQAKVKPFYMVYVMGQGSPGKTYDNAAEAANEARRLCDKERKSAYVLKAIVGYEFFSRVDDIEVEEQI